MELAIARGSRAWFVLALLCGGVVALAGASTDEPNPHSAARAQIFLEAESPIRAILTDSQGRSDTLPGGLRHIAGWSWAGFATEHSDGYELSIGPTHYDCAYQFYWPISDGPFTLSAFADSGARKVLLTVDKAFPTPYCDRGDRVTVDPKHAARWKIEWNPLSRSDTCWIRLSRLGASSDSLESRPSR